MSLDTPTIRQALTARVATVSGLREAKGPLGLNLEPASVLDRSFEVVFTGDADAGERVRAGGRMWITMQFEVRLAHRLPTKGGASSRDQAYRDHDATRRVLLTHANDAIKECESTITYGGTASPEDRGGGVWMLTIQRWALRYDASLVA